MVDREQLIANVVREVMARMQAKPPAPPPAETIPSDEGVFETVDQAVRAAAQAQQKVAAMSLDERGRMIAVVLSAFSHES